MRLPFIDSDLLYRAVLEAGLTVYEYMAGKSLLYRLCYCQAIVLHPYLENVDAIKDLNL